MKIYSFLIFLFLLIFFQDFNAQHHDKMRLDDDSLKINQDAKQMSHSFSLNLPMNRNGSGTGWLPDDSPMYGYMKHFKKWMFMFHGSLFFRYNKQDIFEEGKRGDEKWDAPNWFMAMGQRKTGKRGLFRFNTMFSLDPLSVGEEGYPLLFQTGETYKGKSLVDNQHPHDLFDELSLAYTHMVSKNMDITSYLAYPGEPAFGPVAFMHRISSFNNPDAPLGHHWQDATHITFGVATLGLRYKKIKLEGSAFTGREPDEHRYNFDKARFDSYSLRMAINPNDNFSFQFSHAYLSSPEALEPGKNIRRETISIVHSQILGEKKHWNSSAIWGYNFRNITDGKNSFLVESDLQIKRTAVYGRYEIIQKDNLDLQIPQQNGGEQIFLINMLSLGISNNFLTVSKTNFRAGLQGTIYSSDKNLESYYGINPLAFEAYLHLIPINVNAFTDH